MTNENFEVKTLGERKYLSPLKPTLQANGTSFRFVNNDRILLDASLSYFEHCLSTGETPVSVENAGPHTHLYFDPAKTKVAIVTCGGL